MVPVTFGSASERLFGAFHSPTPREGESIRTCGVVLCNPGGWEAFASQRAYRILADRLAAVGFPVLRFDYAGTGDSAGTDLDPGRVRAWLDSVGAAIDELKRRSGVSLVSLVGVQLGATFAAIAANERHDGSIASLVLWAPYLTGRAYVRQVRAYRLLNNPSAAATPTEYEEAAGYVLTQETVEHLSKLDLLGSPSAPCGQVLILPRDAQSPEEKLATRLRGQGASVEVAVIDGYVQMMQEPRKSVLPEAVFDKVVAWLGEAHPQLAVVDRPPVSTQPAVLEAAGYREEALFLARDERAFGILTLPVTRPSQPKPVVVWLNTAADHRIGPNRLYVTLARRLAGLGFTSVRFDPSGVGDGAAPELVAVAHPYSTVRQGDVRDVLDWLSTERSAQQFVLIGLCSAAFVAFHAALEDPRVVSEILINPQTFVWREGDSLELTVKKSFGSNRTYRQRLLDPSSWKRALRGEVDLRGIAGVVAKRVVARVTRPARRLLPQRPGALLDVEGALRRKLKRETDVLFVFGENDAGLDYIQGHLGALGGGLRRSKRFRFEVVGGTDHTFSPHAAQAWLSGLICDHLTERFGP